MTIPDHPDPPCETTTSVVGAITCPVVRPSVISARARFDAIDPTDRERLERAAMRLGLGTVRPSSEGLLGDGI